ncbi:MAG: sensor domain-containing protein [Mycobacterium sp.]|uniref:sensor domain-containing protein n=1 Tax=Mycobacterium sp. TaxID=1785 RepID=UPI003C3D5D7F
MRRLGVIAVLVWTLVGCTSTVAGTATGRGGAKNPTAKAHGLGALLLSLDEMKQLLKFDDMDVQDTLTRPEDRGIYQPANCVGAVFSSMAGSYDGSGYRDFYEVRQTDMSGGGVPHWVDQSAATFDNDAAAKGFVANQSAQWRQCAGRQFKYAYPLPTDWQDSYRIGDTIDSGCATMISNVSTGDKQYTDIRVLAAKSNIVVDLQFTGFDLTDQPATAVNRILDRIAARGHECAFWS